MPGADAAPAASPPQTQEQQAQQQQQPPKQQQAKPPAAEALFVQALSDTLNQLNEIYMEKEETSVIRIERLEAALAAATTPQQLSELHKQFVDFHGEVLLLVHWSILAYTATVKILKKHHKRTGLLVQAPHLGNLLGQPFCSTEVRGQPHARAPKLTECFGLCKYARAYAQCVAIRILQLFSVL